MRPVRLQERKPLPQTRAELEAWVRAHLRLPGAIEASLLDAIDAVFTRHEHLWQESKEEAIRALSAGFSDKMARATRELQAREATVSSISRYFEQLVADLTDRSNRDPKTTLVNFRRFIEQLESFLALDQRGDWCAVGLVDIHGFKRYNDLLGHATGDRIIERVALLLREQVRSDDLLAQDGADVEARELHARFGGDEFCFLIPDLGEPHQAHAIAERFRKAVEGFDWRTEDGRLAARPVRVDVGVVCMKLGRLAERRFIARRLASSLVQRADRLMYDAKGDRTGHISLLRTQIENGDLVDIPDDADSGEPSDNLATAQ